MHLSSLTKFDQKLVDQPDIPLKQLLHSLLLESVISEALNHEVLRILEANRDLLNSQLLSLIDKII